MRPKDPLVEVPQTICWYEGLRVALGQKRPYGIEKMVEPEVFRRRSGGYSHNNKWSRYKAGMHLPQRRIREKGEQVSPGSSAVLDHPLWQVASRNYRDGITQFSDDWLRQLGPEMYSWFFRRDSLTGQEVRRGISARKLMLLRQRADLSSLAALSILLREAADQRRYKLSMEIGEVLFRTLLQCSIGGDEVLQIALPKIFEMLVERVFPYARDRHHQVCFEGLDLVAFCTLFQRAIIARRRVAGAALRVDEVDRVVDLGYKMPPFSWLEFSLPRRPLVGSAQSFSDFIHLWQRASDQLYGRSAVKGNSEDS